MPSCLLRVCAVVFLFPLAAGAVTPDELRQLSNAAEREQARKAGQLDSDNILGAIPQKRKQAPVPKPRVKRKPTVTKYGTPPKHDAGKTAAPAGTGRRSASSIPSYKAVSSGKGGFSVDAITPGTQFGISLGAWFKASLSRTVTSADPGLVELSVTEPVEGRRKNMPVGTLLFGRKSLSSNNRLVISLVRGITPDGKEFNVRASVYDSFRYAGLAGAVQVDEDKVVGRAASKGLMAFGSGLLKGAAGSNPIGKAASAGADSAMQDGQRASDIANTGAITVTVTPQTLLVRVDDSF